MRPRREKRELPRPAIADVLVELGADAADIPTGFGWVRMRCPFHGEDRTPSASINHEVNGFACHSCGITGDGLKLLQQQGGMTFREAAERASVLSPESGNRHSGRKPKRRASDLLKGMR